MTSSEAPRLAYVYVPDVDKTAHRYGCASQETRSALGRIESALAEAARRKPASVRLVVSADHGLIDVPIHLPLPREGHVGRLLSAAPSGERRFLFFHVAAGRGDEFAQRFQDGYGATQCLLTVAELADARLLGPEMPEATRRRLGDFAAIPKGAPTILFDGDRPQAASHGGLTPEETVVPLVLA